MSKILAMFNWFWRTHNHIRSGNYLSAMAAAVVNFGNKFVFDRVCYDNKLIFWLLGSRDYNDVYLGIF